jgi:hypothetical protein
MKIYWVIIPISIIVVVAIILINSTVLKEEMDLSFEEKLLTALKNNEIKNYIQYLKFLNDNDNKNINIVSKNVYNEFKENVNLNINDIKNK